VRNEFKQEYIMTRSEKEKLEEKGIKVTICPPRNAQGSGGQKFHLISSSIQHQKGSFKGKAPYGNGGVSTIYNSIYERKARNGQEGKGHTKATQNRAW
jgi:hypothetical protein